MVKLNTGQHNDLPLRYVIWIFACDCNALGKIEYLMLIRDNFSCFSMKPYVVTPHLNRLTETVQTRGHNIWFYAN